MWNDSAMQSDTYKRNVDIRANFGFRQQTSEEIYTKFFKTLLGHLQTLDRMRIIKMIKMMKMIKILLLKTSWHTSPYHEHGAPAY
mgnify:CR=1 FL=1